ncbi:MAG: hypothetical protein LZ172_02935 [Thaumarchaeota archaeon]|jgi:hypothetical protein|nr:hypothetical protein [Candidatus Geocrenenecus arthurdayi]MCL7390953.1 hypothetical protein [Candidatus Geocrenenecus arthurdayi]MCL7403287.1 hypothetical protein [Candidatus Geocrenenecus arthurdayi]
MLELQKFYLLCIVLAFASLVIYVYGYFNREFIVTASNIIFPVYALIPALSAYTAMKNYELKSIIGYSMFTFFLGLLFWFLGEVAWAIYVLVYGVEVPFPSAADIFYVLGYPPLYLGLISYLNVFKDAFNRRVISISFTAGLIVVIVTSLLVIPEALMSSNNLIEAVLAIIYPIFDSVLIILAIMGAVIFFGGRIWISWMLISISFILLGIVEISYYYLELLGLIWEGHPLELIWLWVYLYLAMALYSHAKQISKYNQKIES